MSLAARRPSGWGHLGVSGVAVGLTALASLAAMARWMRGEQWYVGLMAGMLAGASGVVFLIVSTLLWGLARWRPATTYGVAAALAIASYWLGMVVLIGR